MKSPAFQFYPADYLSDMKVRMLSWASRGLYMDLLCYCWREGWIPSDSSAIAQLCHCHDLAIVEPCLSLFDSHPDDPKKLIHKRLDFERNKQLGHSNERSNAGKKGAKARWDKGKRADGSAIILPMAKNSSSSSSSSSEDNKPQVAIPLPFDSEKFREAWNQWLEHKREIKQKMPQTTIKRQFDQIKKWGELKSIQAIHLAIQNNWRGLFEPNTKSVTPSGHRPTIEPTNYINPTSTGHRSPWD